MKSLIVTLVFFIAFYSSTWAQSNACDCKSEIDYYFNASKKLESYKTQIKRKSDVEYNAAFKLAQTKLSGDENLIECYLILSELTSLIKDEHARVYLNGYDYGSEGYSDTQETIQKLKASNYYKQLPRASIDLDSLKNTLSTKNISDVAGIYEYGTVTTGIYQLPNTDQYLGVVLSSESEIWEPGMIQAYYRKISEDRYQTVFSTLRHDRWYNIRNDEFLNGRFFISRATKQTVPKHYDEIAAEEPTFQYKKLEKNTDYIRLGSFSRMTSNWNKSKEFVAEIKDKLNGENLIIDLRNNSGGADKVSKPYWKIAKKYARKGHVFLLVNNYTTSNAEITTEMIKRNENVTIVGRNTNGVCAYGSNYGNTSESNSGSMFNVMTDMDYSYLLKYEEVGIPVDVELDLEREWIPQVLELIKS